MLCICAQTRNFLTLLATHGKRKLALLERVSAEPTGDDTLLVIEVSDSTFRYDRKIKAPLYARYGIPQYWIVEIESARLHFFRSLAEGRYTDVSAVSTPGMIELPGPGGRTVDLSRLLMP